MRIPLSMAAAALAALAACGTSHDPDPETVKEPLVIIQGDSLDGEARTDDHYPFLDWYTYDEDVDDLPPGFYYGTDDLFFDDREHLWVEYELSVAPWVSPGEYRFSVTYDFFDVNSIFREEVEFRFRVEVVAMPRQQNVVLGIRQEVAPEARETGADVDEEAGQFTKNSPLDAQAAVNPRRRVFSELPRLRTLPVASF